MGSKLPYKHIAAFGAIGIVGFFSFGQDSRIPLIWRFDLGMHELGHLIGYILPIPEVTVAAAGSVAQVIVPIGLAVYFGVGLRDRAAAAVCVAWTAASLQNVAVYVADAPYERLSLIGGRHDWAFILGPENLNSLNQADDYALYLRSVGLALLAFSLLILLVDLWRDSGPPKYLETPEVRERSVRALDWG